MLMLLCYLCKNKLDVDKRYIVGEDKDRFLWVDLGVKHQFTYKTVLQTRTVWFGFLLFCFHITYARPSYLGVIVALQEAQQLLWMCQCSGGTLHHPAARPRHQPQHETDPLQSGVCLQLCVGPGFFFFCLPASSLQQVRYSLRFPLRPGCF